MTLGGEIRQTEDHAIETPVLLAMYRLADHDRVREAWSDGRRAEVLLDTSLDHTDTDGAHCWEQGADVPWFRKE